MVLDQDNNFYLISLSILISYLLGYIWGRSYMLITSESYRVKKFLSDILQFLSNIFWWLMITSQPKIELITAIPKRIPFQGHHFFSHCDWHNYVECTLLYNPCNRQVTDIPFLINITSSMCILNWFCWCVHDCQSSYFAPFLYPRVISWMIQSKRTCCLFGITQSSESQACLANDSLSSHATAESFNLE